MMPILICSHYLLYQYICLFVLLYLSVVCSFYLHSLFFIYLFYLANMDQTSKINIPLHLVNPKLLPLSLLLECHLPVFIYFYLLECLLYPLIVIWIQKILLLAIFYVYLTFSNIITFFIVFIMESM